jgi:hypothetical protein
MNAWSVFENAINQFGGGFNYPVAIIEDDQRPLITKKLNESRKWVFRLDNESEHGCECAWYEKRICEGREINKENSVPKVSKEHIGHSDSERSLSDSARSDDGNETLVQQLCRRRLNNCIATDDPTCSGGQVMRWTSKTVDCCRAVGRGRVRKRCHEAIATPWDIGNIPGAPLAIAQHPA